jgi:hypothetical protein
VHAVEATDSGGWASLKDAPRGPALVDLKHGIVGRCFGIPIDASQDEIEVTLAANGFLELALRDGDESLRDVVVRLETNGGVVLSESRSTDEAGRVRFEPMGEGAYHLSCQRAGCWTVFVDRALGPDEHATLDVQMRRLADLQLTVRNGDGLPVTGVEIELRSEEFDVQVSDWLAADKVRSEGSLRSDLKGEIHLQGLPRGPYTWRVRAGEEEFSGSFELEPAKLNTVIVPILTK